MFVSLSRMAFSVGLLSFSTLSASTQSAQTIKQLAVGTWALLESEGTQPDGTKTPNFGPSPKGRMVLDAAGNFSIILMSSAGRPRFAADNRMRGEPEEYRAAVQGSIAYFGTYTLNEERKTIRFHIDGSLFPNWEGSDQERAVTVTPDEMTYTAAAASNGLRSENKFRRLD